MMPFFFSLITVHPHYKSNVFQRTVSYPDIKRKGNVISKLMNFLSVFSKEAIFQPCSVPCSLKILPYWILATCVEIGNFHIFLKNRHLFCLQMSRRRGRAE